MNFDIDTVFTLLGHAITITAIIVGMRYQIKEIKSEAQRLKDSMDKIVLKDMVSIGDKLLKHDEQIKDLEMEIKNE